MQDLLTHPSGDSPSGALAPVCGPIAVDTFGGRIHVDWNPDAAVTPLGQLPFFIEFLHVSGLFDDWVSQSYKPQSIGCNRHSRIAPNFGRICNWRNTLKLLRPMPTPITIS